MKKISLFVLCFLSIALVWCTSPDSTTSPSTATAPVEETVMLSPSQETESYKIYSAAAFDEAVTNGKRVVLNFRASRCPTCTRVSNDIIEKQAGLPEDVVVMEVDYDTNEALKDAYGVTQQTTFVTFDNNWNALNTLMNVRSFNDLVNNL